jgi:hypothetical protein
MLRTAGILVVRHADHFLHDTPDEKWLPDVASRRWVALTRDQRIRYEPNQKRALVQANARLLVLIGKAPHAELAANFIRTIDKVTSFIDEHEAPFIGKVYRASPSDLKRNPDATGRLELWYP